MMGLNKARLLSNIKWLGREGSNLRMAESKSAALPLGYAPTGRTGMRAGGCACRTGSDNARSIEGVRPFQQAGKPNFVRNQLPGSVTLYNRTAYAKAPGRFHAPGAAQYRPSEC